MSTIPVLRFETMWELLQASLEDLRKVEQMPGYAIDMTDWHVPTQFGRCAVCMAGAMLATRGLDSGLDANRITFDQDTENQLSAVDYMRLGYLGSAAESFYGYNADKVDEAERFKREVPDYRTDRAAFFAAQEQLVQDLKAAGL